MHDTPEFAAGLMVVLVVGLLLKCSISPSQGTGRTSLRRPTASSEVSFELPQGQPRDLTY